MTTFIELGNITFEGRSDIPTVEIMAGDKITGYLTPFRGYSFQVSGDKHGDGDYGASPVIAFYKDVLKGIPKSAALTLLSGQATMALVSHRGYAENITNTNKAEPENPVQIHKPSWAYPEYAEKFTEFIEKSYEWIMR